MERINIRIAKKTHRRLNLIKGMMGISHLADSAPTLDEVINAGLDLLERGKKVDSVDQGAPAPQPLAEVA